MELENCFPTPVSQLPLFIRQFVEIGKEAQKETEMLDPKFSSQIITDINHKVCRLWTYAMAEGKAFSMMLRTPDQYIFIAFKIENQEEVHSLLELPPLDYMMACVANEIIAAAHDAVCDLELNHILCLQSEQA